MWINPVYTWHDIHPTSTSIGCSVYGLHNTRGEYYVAWSLVTCVGIIRAQQYIHLTLVNVFFIHSLIWSRGSTLACPPVSVRNGFLSIFNWNKFDASYLNDFLQIIVLLTAANERKKNRLSLLVAIRIWCKCLEKRQACMRNLTGTRDTCSFPALLLRLLLLLLLLLIVLLLDCRLIGQVASSYTKISKDGIRALCCGIANTHNSLCTHRSTMSNAVDVFGAERRVASLHRQ